MESGLIGQDCNRIRRFSVQTLLNDLPGLGTRPCHNAPGDPQVKN